MITRKCLCGEMSWRKHFSDCIQLFFPSMTFPRMLSMWFWGEISKNISPYRMLRCKDVKQVKCGKKKLSNMKTLVKHVMRAGVISNGNDLVVNWWSLRTAMNLYRGVRHLFYFPYLTSYKRSRYETVLRENYFAFLMKKEGVIYVEQ